MTRKLIVALGLMAFVTPALGDDAPYYDEQSGAWVNDGPPPDSAPQYPPDPQTNVDVSVDLAAPGASVGFSTFQEPLAQYGQWVTVGPYGRVWRPTQVGAGWRPYFYGRWEWTDEGWLWVSDEPWGWAAYHYGRWANDPSYGWVWVPGYQWAPAWVTWRYSPEYIGWAPLGPGFSVYVTSYPVNYGWWTFVPCRRFVGVPVHNIAYTGGYVRGIFQGTQPAPPRAAVYGARAPAWGGPARPFVEQRIGHAINPVRVQPVASPAAIRGTARPGIVPVYRPEARLPVAHATPAPGRGPQATAAPGAAFRGTPAPQSAAAGHGPAQRSQGSFAPAPGRAQQPTGPDAAPGRQQGHGPAPAGSSQGSFAPARPQQTNAPGRPQGSYAPARPQRTNAPGRPQGSDAPARPQQMNAPARPQGSYAPARPQQMNAPARPQGSYAPARPQQTNAPARPQQGGFAPAPSRAPAPAPAQGRPQGFAPPSQRPQAYAAARAPAFAAARPTAHAMASPRPVPNRR